MCSGCSVWSQGLPRCHLFIPSTLEGYFFQSFLMQANLVLGSLRSRWGDLLVLQGRRRTREGWKIYWSPGSFESLYPGFCETWVKNKGFDMQLHSSLTDVHLTFTLHTSVMSTAPVFLFLSANSWSCLMLSPWLLALYKRMQGMDYLLCSSRLYPPAPLLQTKWAPFHQYFLLAFDKG